MLWESRAYRLYFRILFVKFYGSFKLVPFFIYGAKNLHVSKRGVSRRNSIRIGVGGEYNFYAWFYFWFVWSFVCCVCCAWKMIQKRSRTPRVHWESESRPLCEWQVNMLWMQTFKIVYTRRRAQYRAFAAFFTRHYAARALEKICARGERVAIFLLCVCATMREYTQKKQQY